MKMKRIFKPISFLLLLLVISGCVSNAPLGAPTSTPEPLNPAIDFFVEVQRAESTAKAIEATQIWIWGQLTATAQVKEENATQQAAVATQQAYNMQTTATHDAFIANQFATQRSFEVTSTAQAIGTATAFPQTATAQSVHQTQTQQAWQTTATMDAAYGAAQATAAAGNAESVALSVERDRATNMTKAWLPWMAFAVAMALITVMGIRYSRVRVVQKDAFGATQTLILDGTVLDMDSSTSMRRLKDGSVDWQQGSEIMTERKQKVDLVRALPVGKQDIPPIIMEGPRQTPRIEVLEEGNMNRMLLDEIEDQIIEEE